MRGGYVVLPLEAYEKLKEAARRNETTINIEVPKMSEMIKRAELKEQKASPAKEKKETPKEKKPRVDHGKVNALHKAGWSAAKIADEMGISVATVYNHIDKE